MGGKAWSAPAARYVRSKHRDSVRLRSLSGTTSSDSYHQPLREKGVPVATRLAGLVTKGRLTIYVPRRTIHSKLYVLSNKVGISRLDVTKHPNICWPGHQGVFTRTKPSSAHTILGEGIGRTCCARCAK